MEHSHSSPSGTTDCCQVSKRSTERACRWRSAARVEPLPAWRAAIRLRRWRQSHSSARSQCSRRCTAGERSSAHSVAGSTTAMAQDVIGQLVSRQCRSTRQWSALAYAATAARSCASMCATAASAASRCRQSQRRSAAKAGGSVRDRILACRSSGRSCSRGGPAVTCECASKALSSDVVKSTSGVQSTLLASSSITRRSS
mmetsp:Transcript_4152/g.13432  ORF Transcript_4152/g.13432 Transcript_4152/m.13432 type:complete len:200 (+) Transcript_4152:646-1245(+)